jgi:ribosome-associated protein
MAVLPPLVVTDQITIARAEFRLTFVRSSGPGGQNVNKTSTKVVLRWDVTESESLSEAVRHRFLARYRRRITEGGELILTSERYRQRGRNIEDALQKVRALILAVAHPPKVRKKKRRSKGSKESRLRDKRAISDKKRSRQPPDFSGG